VAPLEHVEVPAMDPHAFENAVSPEQYEAWLELVDRGARELRGRVIWNVNSTARGGGVAEMLWPLLGYSRGSGVDARWVVIRGDREFFALTKRLHNHLHGQDGDGGPLGPEERAVYERNLEANAAELCPMVTPRDIVILHDPQTAGLVSAMHSSGATVIWRCHVGLDTPNECARKAWRFLLPHVLEADAYVFSRATFAWEGLENEKIAVIQPSIDVFSPKNVDQSLDQCRAILARAGITSHRAVGVPVFTRSDGTPSRVDRSADMVEESPIDPEDRVLAQVSRWDRLKDPLGVLQAFALHIAEHVDVHLLLAGPSTEAVADDPEGAQVLAEVRDARDALPDQVRRRVHLASLPMEDVEENAAIVNAIQRHAEVVAQKSLAEGFGLTVAEAMWKQRPVVASKIGGIQDQIVHGESGMLISDPTDLREFGSAVVELLSDAERARGMGTAARERVREQFLATRHLGRYFELIQRLAGGVESPSSPAPPTATSAAQSPDASTA
jgi:trehalose synthase